MQKKLHLIVLLIGTLVLGSTINLNAQTFESRVVVNDFRYLVYQMRETSGTNIPTTSTVINDITFVIRYPSGAVTTSLLCGTNNYNIIDGTTTGEKTFDGYDYWYWNSDAGIGFNPPNDWTLNVWEDICIFTASGATGSSLFEIAPNEWDGRSLNWNQTVGATGTDFLPSIIAPGISYSYPTTIYSHVWTGGIVSTNDRYNRWERGGNWQDQCGNAVGDYPFETDNAYIPDVSGTTGNFPEVTTDDGWACLNLYIANGAHITVPDLTPASDQNYFKIDGDLTIEGILNIDPSAYASVEGSTTINSSMGLTIQADATGVGSFIDNGTITYGTGGTAKVQTYLSNSAGAGNFDIHLVGPTVDEENYTGGGTGAFLSAFAIDASTYAYEYNDGWQNINSNTFEVRTANGIGLSTIDNTNHTLEMTGSLMTGNQSSPTLAFSTGANNYELISNPYPSSIDFDALAGTNSGVVFNKYWIWDPVANSYVIRAATVGGAQHIQVGQAFFVETVAAGTFNFTNTERSHSNDAFRETLPNILTITAEGGMEGYKDVSIIRFTEEATFGYDKNIEAKFWESQNSDATSLRSVTENNLELAINVLPTESLSGEMLSVPLKFDCGYSTEYTLSFTDIETFEMGTEIYLEDLKTGEDWIYINDNPIYTFNAASYQSSDRFIVHFFGPTGMEEISEENIDIYSSGQYAYVRNNTDEKIKMIYVYNLSGELIMSTKSDNQKVSKFWVSDHIGYYVVRVITDTNTYTKKVLIFN
jgi:hypothetical protein